ncbi:right-handed parallel beta-helix repeat-containing protein [Sphingomonas sp.]|uniref:right-handed parallel beta-helix repeat-containing protein n=1 Tax=Sphingomonas sp. TaxID=28214 RepID=UPI0028AFA045|nr:right-handed parallel beta-helix repeat-containing protein [Sphingomonas sp.]
MALPPILFALASVAAGSNPQLTAALSAARGGEHIVLRPGNYGQVVVRNRTWQQPVTIESADPTKPATITRLVVTNTTGLTFRNIRFSRALGSEASWARIAEVSGGANISFIGGWFYSTLDNNPLNDMQGLMARGTTGLTVAGVKFQDLSVGITCDDCSKFTIENNVFSFIGVDAIDIPGARGGRIATNMFHSFRPVPKAHPDGIQCWTSGKRSGCKDVTIFSNTFIGDPGHEFQGVFLGDEDNVGGYERITIAYNTFRCTMWNAVYLGGASSSISILNNKIFAGPKYRPWFRTISPVNIMFNVAPDYMIQNRRGVPAHNSLGGEFVR